jgi:hypothetical protein
MNIKKKIMKLFKQIALSAFLTLSAFCAILYSSCSKDGCKGVTCLNGGTCGGGICSCPTGLGGNNCQTVYRLLYANTYEGIATYDIIRADTNNTMVFTAGLDSNYTEMKLVWNDTTSHITMPIVLSDNSANGSVFTITATTVDTITYTGSGTVNAIVASLTLVGNHPTGPPIIVTLNNFTKH